MAHRATACGKYNTWKQPRLWLMRRLQKYPSEAFPKNQCNNHSVVKVVLLPADYQPIVLCRNKEGGKGSYRKNQACASGIKPGRKKKPSDEDWEVIAKPENEPASVRKGFYSSFDLQIGWGSWKTSVLGWDVSFRTEHTHMHGSAQNEERTDENELVERMDAA
ncbi:hypothetical protein LZ32DRAFT_645666 [Colletotrichum eremochloae]|nr:hypothetical protein LZ32DRAFT_645666 [Colletotrichum eremochloae]